MMLGAALLVTLLLVWKVSRDGRDADVATVIEPARHAATASALTGAAMPGQEKPVVKTTNIAVLRMSEDAAGDPFAPMTWFVEPKKQPPPPPPPPVAPPVPFTFYGKVLGDGGVQAVLQQGEETIVAKVGDVVQTDYRVDAIEGDRLNLTYLPLKQKQVLVMGKTAEQMLEIIGGTAGLPPSVPAANGTEMALSGIKKLPRLPGPLPAANE